MSTNETINISELLESHCTLTTIDNINILKARSAESHKRPEFNEK